MKSKFRILVVDDEQAFRESLREILVHEGYHVEAVADGQEAIEKYKSSIYDIVITDMSMPVMDGMEVLKNIKALDAESVVIVVTGISTIEGAVQAIKFGAEDYFTKPLNIMEILKVIGRIFTNKTLARRAEMLKQVTVRKDIPEIIGETDVVIKLLQDIKAVAETDVPVFITGESGSGKELVARAIHNLSLRKDEAFVPINCAAVPHELLESEFFGYEKGAFSGAVNRKYGLFEVADNGTLFLDEISEMPASLQAKLLRVIETKQLRRIGGIEEISIDIRILSATNREIRQEVSEKRFREDLFYRLNTYMINIPPLRERKEDIPLLVSNYLKKRRKEDVIVHEEVISALKNYVWPGNIRELENVIERLLIVSRSKEIRLDDLPEEIRIKNLEISPETNIKSIEDLEREHILKVLSLCNGNKADAAKILQIGLKTLYRKLENYKTNPANPLSK